MIHLRRRSPRHDQKRAAQILRGKSSSLPFDLALARPSGNGLRNFRRDNHDMRLRRQQTLVSSIPQSCHRPPPRTAARAISAKWEIEACAYPSIPCGTGPAEMSRATASAICPARSMRISSFVWRAKNCRKFSPGCGLLQNFATSARLRLALPSRRSDTLQDGQSRQICPPRHRRRSNTRPPSGCPL